MPRLLLAAITVLSLIPAVGSSASIDVQLNQADSLWKSGQPDSAITIALPALSQARSQPTSDSVVANVLYRLGRFCISGGRNDSAKTFLHESVTIRRQSPYSVNPELATTLYYLGAACLLGGDYGGAEPFLEQALELREQHFGKDHLEVGRALIAYSNVKKRLEKYSEAEAASKRAEDIFDTNLPAGDFERYKPLSNLGDIYHLTARPGLAADYYERALGILVAARGAAHSTTAIGQARLAKALYVAGRYRESEQTYEFAIEILEANYGRSDRRVAAEQVNLGLVLMARGDFAGARDLFRAGLDVFRSDTTKQNRWVSNCLRYLAEAQMSMEDYEAAEDLLRQALQVAEDVLGMNNSEVARASSSLADFFRVRKRYAEADSLYRYAIRTSQEAFKGANIYAVRSLNGLGLSLLRQGRLDESELILWTAHEVVKNTFGPNHPELAKVLELLARNFRARGDHTNCLGLIKKAYEIRIHNMNQLAPVLAETDALLYSKYLRETVSSYLSSFFDSEIDSREIVNSVAEAILTTKGPVSDIVFLRNRMWNARGDNALHLLLDEYREARRRLAQRFVTGPASGDHAAHGLVLDSLDKKVGRLETELARRGADLVGVITPSTIQISEIAAKLSDGSSLIEYLRFSYSHLNEGLDEDHYLALVIDRSGVKTLRDLGKSSTIDSVVGHYRVHLSKIEAQLTPPSHDDLAAYLTISGDLMELVFEPIGMYVEDSASLFIALDGALNLVSFAGLPLGNDQYFIEGHPLQYVNAGRDLVDSIRKERSNKGLLAIGDVDFDASPQMRSDSPIAPTTAGPKSVSGPMESFEYDQIFQQPLTRIPGTRREVESLVSSWKRDNDSPVHAYYGAAATEDVVKKFGPGRRVLHFATHGYFVEENRYRSKNDLPTMMTAAPRIAPLLYSGLYLAGANLRGLGSVEMGLDDGILTAEEVGTMNLESCDMVVLSACESGLGDVFAGEGVYGLRRAFQMAGAQSVVSTLWKVPDASTSQFMRKLYSRSDQNLAENLRGTSLSLLNRLRRKGQPDHPFTWAAFVVVGVSR